MKFRTLLVAFGAACALLAMPAHAASYSAVYAFGDSLSDNGQSLTGQPQHVAPYVGGRFSNGPVAVEYLASGLGVNLFDYAVSGATTGALNTDYVDGDALRNTGVLKQVDKFEANLPGSGADASALYLVSGGSNDFLSIDPTNPTDVTTVAGDVVVNLNTAVLRLYTLGARQFLLPLLPDLGQTPFAAANGVAGELSLLSEEFNAVLAGSYGALLAALPDAVFTLFDAFEAQRAVIAGAPGNGFTNVTEPCVDAITGIVCASPERYFYFDSEHPTTAAYAVLGADLLAAVPEPSTWWLSSLGMLMLVSRRRRANAAA